MRRPGHLPLRPDRGRHDGRALRRLAGLRVGQAPGAPVAESLGGERRGDALIQTGPGLPAWRWRSVQLRWNGPVDRSQQIRLWLISPIMNLTLGLVRVALLLGLIVIFFDLRNWRRHVPASLAGIAAILLVMAIGLAPARPLHAETTGHGFPPQPLLDNLQVQEAKESATEAESECHRGFRLKDECRIIQLQLAQIHL